MRILGLDYGDKTVGVAVSDPFGWTAQGLEIIKRNSENEYKQSLGRLAELIKEYEVDTIVLGYPLNLDGSVSERCKKTEAYKERIERRFVGIPVVLWDERLSTVAAANFLMEAGLNNGQRKGVIDKMAAVYILQGYLNSIKK
ncbi:MAG: Holliday junction resolvase RuvX [Lachnospiraceae bacterium]|nr:Holliday junction resolvase RuvX [Lachnospiraceae bacterium]